MFIKKAIMLMLILVLTLPVPMQAVASNGDTNTEQLSHSETSTKEDGPDMEMYVFDVGHGDAILIASKGRYMMVDAGRYGEADALMAKLDAIGVEEFDVALGTHWDGDHIGGFRKLFRNYKINRFCYSAYFVDNALTQNIKAEIARERCPEGTPDTGETWTIGDAKVEVVSDGSDSRKISSKKKEEIISNNSSIVIKVTCGGKSVLITGDATEDREKRLGKAAVDCDVLKVSHHGIYYATTRSFINKTTPGYSVISTNSGLPNVHVLYNLSFAESVVHRTDKHGDIKYTFDSGDISVSTSKDVKSVADAKVTGIKKSYSYKKSGVKPVPTVKLNGKTLYCKQNKKCRTTKNATCYHYNKKCKSIKGVRTMYVTVSKAQSMGKRACGYCVKTPLDFKVNYSNYKKRGTATLKITGLGAKVLGTKTVEYTIK